MRASCPSFQSPTSRPTDCRVSWGAASIYGSRCPHLSRTHFQALKQLRVRDQRMQPMQRWRHLTSIGKSTLRYPPGQRAESCVPLSGVCQRTQAQPADPWPRKSRRTAKSQTLANLPCGGYSFVPLHVTTQSLSAALTQVMGGGCHARQTGIAPIRWQGLGCRVAVAAAALVVGLPARLAQAAALQSVGRLRVGESRLVGAPRNARCHPAPRRPVRPSQGCLAPLGATDRGEDWRPNTNTLVSSD